MKHKKYLQKWEREVRSSLWKQTNGFLLPSPPLFLLPLMSWCQKEHGWAGVGSLSFCTVFRWARYPAGSEGHSDRCLFQWCFICVAGARGWGEEALAKNRLGLSDLLKRLLGLSGLLSWPDFPVYFLVSQWSPEAPNVSDPHQYFAWPVICVKTKCLHKQNLCIYCVPALH